EHTDRVRETQRATTPDRAICPSHHQNHSIPLAPPPAAFFVPTSSRPQNKLGIVIAPSHSHMAILRISSRSRDPIHKTPFPAWTPGAPAHSRNGWNSPKAREQTKSRGATSSPSS